MTDNQRRVDVIIVGGGLVGMTLARALCVHGLETAVVDTADLSTTLTPAFDGRCSAIAAAAAKLFQAIGVWDQLAEVAQPIRDIRVTDGASPLFLHFDGQAVGGEPLGYMFENRMLRAALMKTAAATDGLHLFAPDRLVDWTRGPGKVEAVLAGGQRLVAPLIVAAEGRGSPLREQMGIRSARWSYRQHGIVTMVAHEKPHGDIAYERFLPDGPFAILPMPGQRSAIVWTVKASQGPAIMGLSDAAFMAEIGKRFGDFLGKLELVAPRWSYPLNFNHADHYVERRFALIGDAAHGNHPIAGQGFNLGVRDVAALTEVLVEAARLGLDLGSLEVLNRYQRWRRPDNTATAIIMDGLTHLFSNDLRTVTAARRLGLAAVNRIKPLKTFFMREAMGATGKLPALLRGELA